MEDEVEYTKEEQRYIDDKIRKAKKDIHRQRKLDNLVVGSPWKTIPVYSEVIRVDLDQEAEGIVTIDGEERHLTLTSTLKGVGEAVKQFTELSQAGEFEGGTHVFGLADGGVEISEGNIAEEHLETIEEYRQQIIDGDIEVPEVPGE